MNQVVSTLGDHLFAIGVVTYSLIELVGMLVAVHAVLNARTSQGAIAWSIALVTFPPLTLLLYWVFGRNKFYGYIDARRLGNHDIHNITHHAIEQYIGKLKAFPEKKQDFFHAFEKLAKMPFTSKNAALLLKNGTSTFNAIFDCIENARHYILIQFYIIHDDELGKELQRRLIAKAEQGVKVFLLYDAIGSYDLPKRYISALSAAGVDVQGFTGQNKRIKRFQINFRNHRKIVVVDGKSAFVGGHNVGDEYLGKNPALSPWRDTHVKVTGPGTIGVQLAFVEDWYWTTQSVPELNWTPYESEEQNECVLVLPSSPADTLETCELFFAHAINSARQRVWIVTPYFVPDEAIVSALQLAALRGVDVRILISDKSDNLLVDLASKSFFEEVINSGINLYRYQKGFLHQKITLVDDDIATIGTPNFDNRSFRMNFEITIVFANTSFVQQVSAMLDEDFKHSQKVGHRFVAELSTPSRVAIRIARLFAPIL